MISALFLLFYHKITYDNYVSTIAIRFAIPPGRDRKKGAKMSPEVTNSQMQTGKGQLNAEHLIAHLPVIIYRLKMKPSQTFEYITDNVLEMTGYSAQDHYDDPKLGAKLIYPDDLPVVHDQISSRSSDPIIVRWTRKDGKLIWTQTFLFYQQDEAGELEYIVGIGIDISERMREEQLLQQGLSVLETATEMEKMGGWEWDIGKQALYWTKDVYAIHEIDLPFEIKLGKEAVERSVACYSPEARETIRTAFEKCCTDGTPYELELPFVTEKGKHLWIRTIGKAIWENGKIIKVIGNFSDITERKQREIFIAKSEKRMRGLFEGMTEGFALHQMLYDENGKACDYRFLLVNPAFERMTGLAAEDLVGKTVLEVLPNTEQSWIERYAKVVETGERTVFEDYSRELGKYYHVVANSNRKKYFTVFVHDVSDMVKAKEQAINAQKAAEESNRIKSAFLASMNHELRTPLNHIIGYSNLLPDAKDMEEVRSFSEVIRKSGEHLLQIFEDMFELTLAEHSMLQVNAREVDCFEHYIQNKTNLEDILRASGKEDVIKLVYNPDLSAYGRKVYLDTTKVNQVLTNLMRNAVKFTPKGSVEFGFDFPDHDTIRYYVSDTGIGINPEKEHSIFEIFSQADDGLTRNYGGVGIGLSICRRMTEVMGGKLSFESTVNQGTTFNLFLPVNQTRLRSSGADFSKHTLVNELAGKKILLAEDDQVSGIVLQRFLERYGATTLRAIDGLEAVELCKANPRIDLVLMDKMMPRMNGSDATREIKEMYPNLPVIAITAGYQVGAPPKPEDLVFDSIVTKPINQDILYREIRRFLSLGAK